ncbi:MAG: hypothetical protein COT92_03720 [Candidatus Doudnabacteria bacterium CG10_big_fil_rev_8_21_14_0_10_42_18]|uniref:Response regulatory domain-containing protein n=1 Tax=Candidatus Doudnabacteria bacterium CG10_big_fil_rev_8_21_14_0_10_42_18 TaxID=1974552 RepID=A0A2H0VA05_9BACT|nr:MAG: hypothetical protein COT92_03720 [Candidatus Doudnabacteria bacterium CG10_big_fil_rev_8_21_14_0_10_42_18]
MKHSILVVDDDTLIINTLKKNFESFETDVYSAETPEEAKGLLDKTRPDLLILDLLLTKEDGSVAILDYLKSKEALKNIPVLILTNLDKPELKTLLLGQGVKEYIIKGSLSLDELHKKVLSYLEPEEA